MKRRRELRDPVDRARAGVSRAIGQLVKLLDHEDEDVICRTLYALQEFAPFCVGPLATALAKERNPSTRVAIICLIRMFSQEPRTEVTTALLKAAHRDPDRNVRLAAWAAHAAAIAQKLAACQESGS
jgi:hypothetical protein